MDNNWKLVPVEPTEAMYRAVDKHIDRDGILEGEWYSDMLAAAPTPDNNGWMPDPVVEMALRDAACVFDRLRHGKPDDHVYHLLAERCHKAHASLPPPPALDKGE